MLLDSSDTVNLDTETLGYRGIVRVLTIRTIFLFAYIVLNLFQVVCHLLCKMWLKTIHETSSTQYNQIQKEFKQ